MLKENNYVRKCRTFPKQKGLEKIQVKGFDQDSVTNSNFGLKQFYTPPLYLLRLISLDFLRLLAATTRFCIISFIIVA